MKAISLFSGAGGFEIGFERAGIRTVLQAESDPVCLSVLARHWPEVDRVDDVRSVHKDDTPPLQRRPGDLVSPRRGTDPEWIRLQRRGGIATNGVDLVYGGWPCQGNSVAGKRGGLSDERSGLWHEVGRVLRELRPRWFVGENVPGLLSVNRGLDFLRVLMDLDELGYGVAWRTLDARFFGVPQRRRRVFLVGCLGDARRAAQVLAVCESCGGHPASRTETRQRAASETDGGARESGAWSTKLANTRSNQAGKFYEEYTPALAHNSPAPAVAGTLEASYGRLQGAAGQDAGHGHDTLVVAATLSGGGHAAGVNLPGRHHEDDENLIYSICKGSDPIWAEELALPQTNRNDDPGTITSAAGVRRLTPLECERLQGFPDEWTRWGADGKEIADSHRYRLMGNAVATVCAQWLGYRLVEVDRQIHAKEGSHS